MDIASIDRIEDLLKEKSSVEILSDFLNQQVVFAYNYSLIARR